MLVIHKLQEIRFNPNKITIVATNKATGQNNWQFRYSDVLHVHSDETEFLIECRGTWADHRFRSEAS